MVKYLKQLSILMAKYPTQLSINQKSIKNRSRIDQKSNTNQRTTIQNRLQQTLKMEETQKR